MSPFVSRQTISWCAESWHEGYNGMKTNLEAGAQPAEMSSWYRQFEGTPLRGPNDRSAAPNRTALAWRWAKGKHLPEKKHAGAA
jgi:hypothetical protein